MAHRYRVAGIAGLTLPAGEPVKLSDSQLKLRAHQVAPSADFSGFHVSERDRLQFKAGETVELARPLPKAQVATGQVVSLDAEGLPLAPPAAAVPAPSGAGRAASRRR